MSASDTDHLSVVARVFHTGRRSVVRMRAVSEALRQSLFFVPTLFLAGAVVLSTAMLFLDRNLGSEPIPGFLLTTVASSRSLLGTVAGGTITAASIVFSLTLVAVQLSSGQHSPRLLRSFIGDRFQQVVIGVVVGTFTYCVLVLRAVRSPLEQDGTEIVPSLSIIVAVALAVAALLAVLASIDHTARSLKVESISTRLTSETEAMIRKRFPTASHVEPAIPPGGKPEPPAADTAQDARSSLHDPTAVAARVGRHLPASTIIRAPRGGWVRQISEDVLFDALPPSAHLELRVAVGSWLLEGAAMFDVRTEDELEPDERATLCERLYRAVDIGEERTMLDDIDFGFVRLVDVALRALSPGINDPTTALEITMRLGTLLSLLQRCDLGKEQHLQREGRSITQLEPLQYRDYIHAAFDQIREAAANQVPIYAALLRLLATLHEQALHDGNHNAAASLREFAADVQRTADRQQFLPRETNELRRLGMILEHPA